MPSHMGTRRTHTTHTSVRLSTHHAAAHPQRSTMVIQAQIIFWRQLGQWQPVVTAAPLAAAAHTVGLRRRALVILLPLYARGLAEAKQASQPSPLETCDGSFAQEKLCTCGSEASLATAGPPVMRAKTLCSCRDHFVLCLVEGATLALPRSPICARAW